MSSGKHFIFIGIFFVLVLFLVLSWTRTQKETPNTVSASGACASIEAHLSLQATAAYAVDLTTGKTLYQKNANVQLPLASLTKLMTVAVASRSLSPNDTVVITREALAPEGDSGLKIGERWNAEDLIDYTLIVSANDGANAIALAAAAKEGWTLEEFVNQMNSSARTLGMQETYFGNDTGLDISTTTASAYGSARDVAALIAWIVKESPRLLEGTHQGQTSFTSLSGYTHKAENTSGVISSLDGAIASKTGYTDLAGGNLAVVFEPMPGKPVAAVVLGSTRSGRDTDMEALAEGARAALKREILCKD